MQWGRLRVESLLHSDNTASRILSDLLWAWQMKRTTTHGAGYANLLSSANLRPDTTWL